MRESRINWRRITAEFFVIFVGITLSLAADDWRQSLEDRARERNIVEGLVHDLRRDSVEMAGLVTAMQRWDAASVWLNENAAETGPPSPDAAMHLRGLGLISFYQPVTSTYASIRDAGQMNLLRASELRARVVEYFEVKQLQTAQMNELARQRWDQWFGVSTGYVDWVVLPDTATMWRRHQNMNVIRPVADLMADQAVGRHVDWVGLWGGNVVQVVVPTMEQNSVLRRDLLEYIDR